MTYQGRRYRIVAIFSSVIGHVQPCENSITLARSFALRVCCLALSHFPPLLPRYHVAREAQIVGAHYISGIWISDGRKSETQQVIFKLSETAELEEKMDSVAEAGDWGTASQNWDRRVVCTTSTLHAPAKYGQRTRQLSPGCRAQAAGYSGILLRGCKYSRCTPAIQHRAFSVGVGLWRLDSSTCTGHASPSSRLSKADHASLRPQEVASILLTRGALKFGQLTALSNLPPSTIQTCLLVLSIHSLLWHSETDVNGRLVELYEMNEVNIERRLRGGFYVDMAREWDENAAFDCVVESLWRDGMQRRDTLTETAANVLLMRQESLPDGLKKGDKKGKGKAKVEDFASGVCRVVLIDSRFELTQPALTQRKRLPPRCSEKPSQTVSFALSRPALSCRPAHSKSNGKTSCCARFRVSEHARVRELNDLGAAADSRKHAHRHSDFQAAQRAQREACGQEGGLGRGGVGLFARWSECRQMSVEIPKVGTDIIRFAHRMAKDLPRSMGDILRASTSGLKFRSVRAREIESDC